jgi:hypothetical protein
MSLLSLYVIHCGKNMPVSSLQFRNQMTGVLLLESVSAVFSHLYLWLVEVGAETKTNLKPTVTSLYDFAFGCRKSKKRRP